MRIRRLRFGRPGVHARWLARLLWLGLWLDAASASAHMPLVRELAVSADGARAAAHMPGFGWVVGAPSGAFHFLCDALVDVPADIADPPWLLTDAGALLVGTRTGLIRTDESGCPDATAAPSLRAVPIAAVAKSESDPARIYTVTAGSAPALHVSADGGRTFSRRARLPVAAEVTSLVVSAGDAERIYATHALDSATALSWSSDGGETFASHEQPGNLQLLRADADGVGLWARLTPTGGRGEGIAHAAAPDAAFEVLLDVFFYGGFARVARTGELWVGDEGAGLYAFDEAFGRFEPAGPPLATGCLAAGADGLFGCLSGLPDRPAIVRIDAQTVEPVLALSDVRSLVRCPATLLVEDVCEAAWREWRADVLAVSRDVLPTQPSPSDPERTDPPPVAEDSALDRDAGPDPAAALEGDASLPSAIGAAVEAPRPTGAAGGCSLSARRRPQRTPALLWLLGVSLLLGGRRAGRGFGLRSQRMSGASPDTALPSGESAELAALTDVALVARAKTGDVEAFAAIYDRHAHALFPLARRMLGDANDARDLLQDVFIEAWQGIRGYDPARANVRTWLRVKTRSRALDRMGRRAREAVALAVLARAEGAGHAPGARETDAGATVRAALAELESGVRDALELRYYAGMTAAEIGARVGLPEGTVRSRLARGLRQLSMRLREGEVDPT